MIGDGSVHVKLYRKSLQCRCCIAVCKLLQYEMNCTQKIMKALL